jgi:hypothetical protein
MDAPSFDEAGVDASAQARVWTRSPEFPDVPPPDDDAQHPSDGKIHQIGPT